MPKEGAATIDQQSPSQPAPQKGKRKDEDENSQPSTGKLRTFWVGGNKAFRLGNKELAIDSVTADSQAYTGSNKSVVKSSSLVVIKSGRGGLKAFSQASLLIDKNSYPVRNLKIGDHTITFNIPDFSKMLGAGGVLWIRLDGGNESGVLSHYLQYGETKSDGEGSGDEGGGSDNDKAKRKGIGSDGEGGDGSDGGMLGPGLVNMFTEAAGETLGGTVSPFLPSSKQQKGDAGRQDKPKKPEDGKPGRFAAKKGEDPGSYSPGDNDTQSHEEPQRQPGPGIKTSTAQISTGAATISQGGTYTASQGAGFQASGSTVTSHNTSTVSASSTSSVSQNTTVTSSVASQGGEVGQETQVQGRTEGDISTRTQAQTGPASASVSRSANVSVEDEVEDGPGMGPVVNAKVSRVAGGAESGAASQVKAETHGEFKTKISGQAGPGQSETEAELQAEVPDDLSSAPATGAKSSMKAGQASAKANIDIRQGGSPQTGTKGPGGASPSSGTAAGVSPAIGQSGTAQFGAQWSAGSGTAAQAPLQPGGAQPLSNGLPDIQKPPVQESRPQTGQPEKQPSGVPQAAGQELGQNNLSQQENLKVQQSEQDVLEAELQQGQQPAASGPITVTNVREVKPPKENPVYRKKTISDLSPKAPRAKNGIEKFKAGDEAIRKKLGRPLKGPLPVEETDQLKSKEPAGKGPAGAQEKPSSRIPGKTPSSPEGPAAGQPFQMPAGKDPKSLAPIPKPLDSEELADAIGGPQQDEPQQGGGYGAGAEGDGQEPEGAEENPEAEEAENQQLQAAGRMAQASQAADQAAAVSRKATDKEIDLAVKEVNKLISKALNEAALWIWGLTIPTFGLSVLLGAIAGDFLWAFKKFLIKKTLKLVPKSLIKAQVNEEDVAGKVKFSASVKFHIIAMNTVVVAFVILVVMFFVTFVYAGCNYPTGAMKGKFSVIGVMAPEACSTVIDAAEGVNINFSE